MNAVIKRLNKFKELPVDCFVQSMFYLQNYYITEFQRGLAGIGNVQLKMEFLHARIPKDEICIPKHVIKPEDIVKHVMAEIDCVREDCMKESMEQPSESVQFSEQQESAPPNEPSEVVQFSEQQESVPPIEQLLETVPSSEQQQESVPSSELSSSSENEPSKDTESLKETLDIDKGLSQKSLARLTVENDNVSFVQQQKAFMVTGTQGKVYAVTLLPREKCQCPSTTQCYHILAAKMYIGDDIENKPRVVNLRMLSNRSLKRND
jgi:hypothetical protein